MPPFPCSWALRQVQFQKSSAGLCSRDPVEMYLISFAAFPSLSHFHTTLCVVSGTISKLRINIQTLVSGSSSGWIQSNCQPSSNAKKQNQNKLKCTWADKLRTKEEKTISDTVEMNSLSPHPGMKKWNLIFLLLSLAFSGTSFHQVRT